MNNKLQSPITSKESFDDENNTIKYGQSIMQSFKVSIEVSILKEININDEEKNIMLFGIFDGHNGPEVSKYLSLHFSQFLTENINFINGNYSKALEETFINIDYSFRALQVQLELTKYSPNKDKNTETNEENKLFYDFLNLFEPRNLEGVNIAEFCGSCGIVILITEKKVFIANAGSSKCIPVNLKNVIIEDKINKEHTIKDNIEIERLNKKFGLNNNDINNNKDKLINDFPLFSTRGFGHLQYKDNIIINLEDQLISIKPDIIEISTEDLNFLIIGNYGCFSNDTNKLSLEKYFLEKYNKNNEQPKISQIMEEYFDSKIKEIEKSETQDIILNNMASIIIEFKHETNIININNCISSEDKEDIHETKDSSKIKNKSEDEEDNL